jgi:hypothetical protein
VLNHEAQTPCTAHRLGRCFGGHRPAGRRRPRAGHRRPRADDRRLDSPTGTAQGVLTSKDAESITKHFKATGPILIDVSTVKRYAQAGCARLKLSFAQDGVQLPGQTTPKRNTVDFGINYCRDGQPPKSLT